jgi:hypothetical protein
MLIICNILQLVSKCQVVDIHKGIRYIYIYIYIYVCVCVCVCKQPGTLNQAAKSCSEYSSCNLPYISEFYVAVPSGRAI